MVLRVYKWCRRFGGWHCVVLLLNVTQLRRHRQGVTGHLTSLRHGCTVFYEVERHAGDHATDAAAGCGGCRNTVALPAVLFR